MDGTELSDDDGPGPLLETTLLDGVTLDDGRLPLLVDGVEGVEELGGKLLLGSLDELLEQHSQQQQPAWWLNVQLPVSCVSTPSWKQIVTSRL